MKAQTFLEIQDFPDQAFYVCSNTLINDLYSD